MKHLVLCLVGAGLLAASPAAAAQQSLQPDRYLRDAAGWLRVDPHGTYRIDPEVVTVRFAEPLSDLPGFLTALEDRADPSGPRLSGLSTVRSNRLGYHDLRLPPGEDPLAVIQLLRDTGLIDSAEENTLGRWIGVPNDTDFTQQFSLLNTGQTGGTIDADIDADLAWDLSAGDPSVIIAVLDSGTQISHPDLSPRVWTNSGEIPANSIDDDTNGFVDDVNGWDFGNGNNNVEGTFFHGTFVAGVAGAATNNGLGVAGVAGGGFNGDQGCTLMCLGVGDNFPVGSILDDAILYAADNGAAVITLSLSVGSSSAIDDAVDDAWNNDGVFIDCAAGNNGFGVSYPASLTNVVSVASTDDNDDVSGFSNSGPENWVAAPGEDIWSTDLGGGYTLSSGTSFSSPHVAGTAGLIFSVFPQLEPADVQDILKLTAEDVEAVGFDNDTGWGRINAFDAVSLALSSDCNGNDVYDATDIAMGVLTDLDGNGIPDECEGNLLFYCTGKTSSLGCVPFIDLAGGGPPSVSTTDSFLIRGNDHAVGQGGILVYSFKKASLDFHGGKLCVKAPITRTAAKTSKLTVPPIQCVGPLGSGRLSTNFNNRIQGGSDPLLTAGQTVFAQWQQRDPINTIGGFADNLSNGVRFTILP